MVQPCSSVMLFLLEISMLQFSADTAGANPLPGNPLPVIRWLRHFMVFENGRSAQKSGQIRDCYLDQSQHGRYRHV